MRREATGGVDGAFGAVADAIGHPTWQDRRMIDIGRVGFWISLFDQYPTSRVREVVAELEALGWPCVWRPEASGRDALVSAATMLEATTTLRVATGIAQIQARHPHDGPRRTAHAARGLRRALPARARRQPRAR